MVASGFLSQKDFICLSVIRCDTGTLTYLDIGIGCHALGGTRSRVLLSRYVNLMVGWL